MTHPEEFTPNKHLRRARSLKGWSQAELAEHVGTSFEMVSRWERGITVPSPYYRERLCAALGQSAEELGFLRAHLDSTLFPSPLVLLASSHTDAEKATVTHLKATLQKREITLWSSRQIGRQGAEHTLREVVQTAQAVLVIISPVARSSRHVRDALELARVYQRPVCGVWIEGERWQECLPKGTGEPVAVIDARERGDPALFEEITSIIEHARPGSPAFATPALATGAMEKELPPDPSSQSGKPVTLQNQVVDKSASSNSSIKKSRTAVASLLAHLPRPFMQTGEVRGASLLMRGMLIGLALTVVAGMLLAGGRLLISFKGTGTERNTPTANVVRGGIWIAEPFVDPDSIPNGGQDPVDLMLMQALYLPLFYGDAQGMIHPGAATEVPTVQNRGISADATIWTFHLRPHLLWSDGQPYDVRDVDYTWKTWLNPQFGANLTYGYDQISSTDVSTDHLTITFHLKRAYAPFLSLWVDGMAAPLPMHYFSSMAPQNILKSSDNLNPKIVSGPFKMEESVPGHHYTLVRNPRYYRANQGLPYLDRFMVRIASDGDAILRDLQAGTITSAPFLQISHVPEYQRLKDYTFLTTSGVSFEGMYFNFHNIVLATHLEVRQAMAMAIDHQKLIDEVLPGLATPLCTDHPPFVHPGYAPTLRCPVFDPIAANKLLDDNGWVKGPDGVRTRGEQRLEFEYSTAVTFDKNQGRTHAETILQRDFQAIGIKLDIQNYPHATFFSQFLPGAQPSPPTGAIADRFDIGEWQDDFVYDPDDAWILACDQLPPTGANFGAYCNHALDALYKQEQATVDPGERQRIFSQIHQIYLKELPLIVLYSPHSSEVVRKGTHNFQPNPITATSNIWEWWCDQGKCTGQ